MNNILMVQLLFTKLYVLIKKRAHIVFLVLFQLGVFVTPLFIKGTHIHTIEKTHNLLIGNKEFLVKTSEWCPIYKFEFVTSFIQDEIGFSLFQKTDLINIIELSNQIFKITYTSCLLRAPPLSY